jgi:hypothetical protein
MSIFIIALDGGNSVVYSESWQGARESGVLYDGESKEWYMDLWNDHLKIRGDVWTDHDVQCWVFDEQTYYKYKNKETWYSAELYTWGTRIIIDVYPQRAGRYYVVLWDFRDGYHPNKYFINLWYESVESTNSYNEHLTTAHMKQPATSWGIVTPLAIALIVAAWVVAVVATTRSNARSGKERIPRRYPHVGGIFCSECGFRNQEGSNYCNKCGCPLGRGMTEDFG